MTAPFDLSTRAGCEAISGPCTSCAVPSRDCRYAGFLEAALKALAGDDAVVEAMAKALCVARGIEPDKRVLIGEWSGVSSNPVPTWHYWRSEARAALSALFDHLGVKP